MVLMPFDGELCTLLKCLPVGGAQRGLRAFRDVEYFIDHRWRGGVKVADGVAGCCGGDKVLSINHV